MVRNMELRGSNERVGGELDLVRHPRGDHAGASFSSEQRAENRRGVLWMVSGVGDEVV
jgi:hypothetical protein